MHYAASPAATIRSINRRLRAINRTLGQHRSYVSTPAGALLCKAAANYSSIITRLRVMQDARNERPLAS